MKRSRIQILIVDDDATQGKALLEAFKRAGYQANWVGTADKALALAQRQEFHCFLVDCMLPKMNGVDLLEEIQRINLSKPKAFLFSGIFKDKTFIKESIDRTQCEGFFTKPLNLEDVLSKVEHALRDTLKNDDPPLLSLYSEAPLSDGNLVLLMEEDANIHGYHLPILLDHLQRSSLSGDLTIISAVGEVSIMSLYDGQVFSARTPDKDTYFGGLAVEFGFVSPDDVLEAARNPARKLLGMKLIESFALSPHAVNVIMEEQLALRISQCVQDHVVSLQWSHRKYSAPDYSLNAKRFETLIGDWMSSKMDVDWLRSCFSLWASYRLRGNYHSHIANVETVSQLMSHKDFKDEKDLPFLFHQLLRHEVFLAGRDEDASDYVFLEKRLDRLLVEFKEKNHFQILGIGQKAHSLELNKAFAELKSYYDPSLLAAECPPGVLVKCTQVFYHIEAAYKVLSNDDERIAYQSKLQNSHTKLMLEFGPIFRAGIIEVVAGHHAEAAKRFQSLIDKKLEFKDLRSYRIWAGLNADRRFAAITFDQVPPEERHSAPYMMAKGVMYRTKGQMQKALEYFRTAHVLDPRLSIAKTELKLLIRDLEKNRGQNRELLKEATSVVENLFGKIKASS